jgi:hypothetical protein
MAKFLIRLVALLFVVPATYFFIYWVPFSLLPLGDDRELANVVSLLCAMGAGWFVWRKLATFGYGVISSIFVGAVLLGGIGFTAGFFGPIIFMPESNQGPLLGLFITGPLGFVVGAVAGLIYWVSRGRKNSNSEGERGAT